MNAVERTKKFLLDNDLREQKTWQLYYDDNTGIKQQIIQANGTNPRIEKLSIRQINAYLGIYTQTPQYVARIVKNDDLKDIIRGDLKYYLSFDAGTTFVRYICVGIEESKQQSVYWRLLLAGLQ